MTAHQQRRERSAATQPRRDQHGSRAARRRAAAPSCSTFYGEVFGWTEGDNTGEAGNPLILYTGAFGQFVYLLPGDPYLTAPALDHFGSGRVARRAARRSSTGRKATPGRDERVTCHRRARAHDARAGPRLHAHERVHRVRAAAHDRAATSGPARTGRQLTTADDARVLHWVDDVEFTVGDTTFRRNSAAALLVDRGRGPAS